MSDVKDGSFHIQEWAWFRKTVLDKAFIKYTKYPGDRISILKWQITRNMFHQKKYALLIIIGMRDTPFPSTKIVNEVPPFNQICVGLQECLVAPGP